MALSVEARWLSRQATALVLGDTMHMQTGSRGVLCWHTLCSSLWEDKHLSQVRTSQHNSEDRLTCSRQWQGLHGHMGVCGCMRPQHREIACNSEPRCFRETAAVCSSSASRKQPASGCALLLHRTHAMDLGRFLSINETLRLISSRLYAPLPGDLSR